MWEGSMGFDGANSNEYTDPATPHLRAIDGINPCDLFCFSEALSYGTTTTATVWQY